MLTIAHDLRYALRGLRRSPGVAAVILLTLAIGIGVNTAIFSFVDAILLKPLPYPNADRIVGIWERRPSGQPNSMTTLNYLDYARQNSVFERIAATTGCCGLTILNGEPAVTLFALHVSPQYFDVFGASAALGRTFAAGDDEPGRDHVIVLSHRAWASRFGSDPALVGKAVRINGEPHTVIGVMPEHGPFDRMIVEAWLPLTFTPDRMNRTSHWLLWLTGGAIARLKPGVTIEAARADLNAIGARMSVDYPDTNKGWSAVVEPYATIVAGRDLQRSLWVLLAAVGSVLLICCVNVANVMLARALAREREVAVRLALGASQGRVIQQFLTESVLISLAGGVLGVAIGYFTMWLLKATLAALPLNLAILPVLIPAEASIGLDWRVLMFTTVLSIGCGIAFGLAPAFGAIRAIRSTATGLGRTTTATARTRRLRNGLIVAEVALAFVLLANAGLLIRSFWNMRRADTGFTATRVLTAELPVAEQRFADASQLHTFMRQVIAAVQAIPGVTEVAFADGMPMQGAPSGVFLQLAKDPVLERVQRPVVDLRLVSPSYFRALGLRLRRGRTLSDLDRENTPLVAVINETLVRKFFGTGDPLGQQLLMDAPGFGFAYSGDSARFDIVGVIADERMTSFDDTREHAVVYVSNEQDSRGFAGLIVRSSIDPSSMERSLRDAIARVDKGQVVEHVRTIDELKAESWAVDRLRSGLLGVFAAIALALAAIGIFGVVSYSVVQRTQEIGIRAALGATPANLIALVLGGGMAWVALGLAAGAIGSFGTTRLLASVLFGVGPSDPITLTATLTILAGVGVLACYLPARRAARIDPLVALRTE
ncbi:MAG TPA: ABC transporter permease [Vicinamibacterales bacterium]|nr:ABC transporter permease [Vicinamibacterales bacterium]